MTISFINETYKIAELSQYQSIRYSKELSCECGHANFFHKETFNTIGYVNTPSGYMIVNECAKCFEKYRHHIGTTGRYDIEIFKNELGLILYSNTM